MTVMLLPLRPRIRSRTESDGSFSSGSCRDIQPSVKTILDLATLSDRHHVILYYLPTPETNGFTTTHTLTHRQRTENVKRKQNNNNHYSNDRSSLRGFAAEATAAGTDESDSPYHGIASSSSSSPSSYLIDHLTRVSESDRGIVHLARLRISSMTIATSSLPYLTRLVSLRLQGNKLTDLPQQIFRLPSLRELDVSQNLLTEISGLIGTLAPTLEELLLQSNHLEYLPQQIGRLTRLRLLDIADNRLGCIPVEVQRLVTESLPSEQGLDVAGAGANHHHRLVPGGMISPLYPQSPMTEHHPPPGSPQSPRSIGQLNEDGGHDDDDYVQIRPGMKCWARGNRFWQVGVPWSSSSSPTAQGGGSSSSVGTHNHSTLFESRSPTSLYPYSAIPLQSSGTPQRESRMGDSTDPSRTDFGVTGIGVHWTDDSPRQRQSPVQPPPNSGYASYHRHHIRHAQKDSTSSSKTIPRQPGHLVDRADYIRDSYTSCSWTLSLADICSQIAGERIHQDPHYFCHLSACPAKLARKRHEEEFATAGSKEACGSIYRDAIGCSLLVMPHWATERLGLNSLPEYHDLMADEDSLENGQDPEEKVQGAMELTIAEREMLSDHCSVCQKRLYFEGMRWKGVGVMDERIVPLEWVACSVQCRGRAEREERGRDGGSQGQVLLESTDDPRVHNGPASGLEDGDQSAQIAASQFLRGFNLGVDVGNFAATTSAVANHFDQRHESPVTSLLASQMEDNNNDGGGIDVRQSVLYGLVTSRAMKRRHRTLSL